MPDPSWLGYLFAAVMMVVGVYCLGRLLAVGPLGRRSHLDVNVGHVLMAFAMVGMLVPRWNVLPIGLWELVFAAMGVWFLVRATRALLAVTTDRGLGALAASEGGPTRHYLIHMVMACTMLYMYWLGMPVTGGAGAVGGMSAMSGPPAGAGDPGLTLFFIVVLLASAVWQLDGIEQWTAPARAMALARAPGDGPGAALAHGGPSIEKATQSDPDERPWMAPRLEVGCHVAMCLAMAYMLVLMV